QLRVAYCAYRGDWCRRRRAAAGQAVPGSDRTRGAEDPRRLHRGLQPQHGDSVDRRRARLHRWGDPAARDPAAAAQIPAVAAGQAEFVQGATQARPDAALTRIMLADFGIARWIGEPGVLTGAPPFQHSNP